MEQGTKGLAPTVGEPLPGEEVEDTALVDRVVAELNSVWRTQGLAMARALAEVVLEAFFHGDPVLYERRRGRHASLRALAARADLQFNYKALWTALAVTVQYAALPASVAEALPVSHHKALLPLKDAAVKVQVATEAAREGWTVRELDERVRAARGEAAEGATSAKPRRGKPALVGALEQLVAAAAAATEGMPAAVDIQRYGVGRARAVLDAAEEELEMLMAALAELRAVVNQAAALDLADGEYADASGDLDDE